MAPPLPSFSLDADGVMRAGPMLSRGSGEFLDVDPEPDDRTTIAQASPREQPAW